MSVIDFDRLVLAPLMSVFGKPIVVTPTASQPGQPAYAARGDLRIQNIDMPLDDGILSTQVITLGVRKADFLVFVAPGDSVVVGGKPYLIDDTDDDPQGHSILTLKRADQS